MELLISSIILSLILWILSKRIAISLLSPVYGLIGIYLLVFVAGGFLYQQAHAAGGEKLVVTETEMYSLIVQIVWTLCAFASGALVHRFRYRKPHRTKTLMSPTKVRKLSTLQSAALLFFGALSLILVVAGNGPHNIYLRRQYLVDNHSILRILGSALLPAAAVGLGAAFTNRKILVRSLAIALAFAALLLTLALCTRVFCLVPSLFFAGALMIKTRQRSLKVAFAITVVLAPFLMILPLTGRRMPEQGLSTLPDLMTELGHSDAAVSADVVNNIFMSPAIAAVSIRSYVGNSFDYVLLGVNPIPGFLTKWESQRYMINNFTPFSAVGDLLRAGTWVGMCYFAIIGLYFAHIDRRLTSVSKPSVSLFALMALSFIFIILTLQYPLRSSTRMIYYMLAIEALTWSVNSLRHRKRRRPRVSANVRQLYPAIPAANFRYRH